MRVFEKRLSMAPTCDADRSGGRRYRRPRKARLALMRCRHRRHRADESGGLGLQVVRLDGKSSDRERAERCPDAHEFMLCASPRRIDKPSYLACNSAIGKPCFFAQDIFLEGPSEFGENRSFSPLGKIALCLVVRNKRRCRRKKKESREKEQAFDIEARFFSSPHLRSSSLDSSSSGCGMAPNVECPMPDAE